MDLKLFISTLLTGLSADPQWDCKTYLGGEGRCILLYDCAPLNVIAEKRHKESYEILKKYNCGYDGNHPKVCCPYVIDEMMQGDVCMTPDGEEGICKYLTDCESMKHQVLDREMVLQERKDFLNRSKCYNFGTTRNAVCCKQNDNRLAQPPTQPPSSNTDLFKTSCVLNAFPPAADTNCCGIESSGVRITNGNLTAIDQFPWVVKLSYTREELSCGGSLISSKYVLTAAHCLVGSNRASREAVSVILGEYNTTNPGRDCVEVPGGGIDCTDGEITIGIESFIVHEGYDPSKVYRHHDIALIRLNNTSKYTDFIRPICLPTVDFTLTAPDNLLLFVAGWGSFDDTQLSSPVKLYGIFPYIGKEQCDLRYGNASLNLVPSQICAGGEVNKDVCKGDSGGPLMLHSNNVYEAVGVISFGPTICGLKNWPSIYTKVYDYLDWIRGNIKP